MGMEVHTVLATRKITHQALGMGLWRRRERQAGEEWGG
jgi:hypothetical protein